MQGGCAVGAFEIPQQSAGADGGELLVVRDEAYRRSLDGDVFDGSGEVTGAGRPGLIDDDQGVGSDPGAQSGTVRLMLTASTTLTSVSAAIAFSELSTQNLRRAGRGCQPDHGPALLGPGLREGTPGDGLAAAGRSECELYPRAGTGKFRTIET